MRRVATTVLLLLTGTGCGEAAYPTPAPVTWAVDVPAPVATYVLLARDDAAGRMTLLPASPTGAALNVDYAYRMPNCGIRGLIDVDGSFWDAVGERDNPYDYSFAAGTFRLTSSSTATFTEPSREVLRLERHRGPKEFGACF